MHFKSKGMRLQSVKTEMQCEVENTKYVKYY